MRRRGGNDSFRIVSDLLSSYKGAGKGRASRRNADSSWGKLLRKADVEQAWVFRWLAPLMGAGIVSGALAGPTVGLAIVGVGVVVLRFALLSKVRKRWDGIDRDLPALLNSIASSVRAGIDPLSALINSREYFPEQTVIHQEIEVLRRGLTEGQDEEELIEGFLKLYEHQDAELFKRCLILSRRHGSSLAEPLHRVTRVVRQRQSFRRKTRAALAMHRMSAIGIAVCAIIIAAMQFGTNAKGVAIALQHPIANKILMVGASLMVIGLWWMMSMGSEERSR